MTAYDWQTCKGCPATIVWAKTVKGKRMPLTGTPDPARPRAWVPLEVPAGSIPPGNVEPTGDTTWGPNGIRLPVVRVLRKDELDQESLTPRWQTHFSTCPKSAEFSRSRNRTGARAAGRRPQWDR